MPDLVRKITAILFLTACGLTAVALAAVIVKFSSVAAVGGDREQLTRAALWTSPVTALICSYGISGWCLLRLRRRKTAVATAVISLLGFPVGTALGVAALVLLFNPSIRSRFV